MSVQNSLMKPAFTKSVMGYNTGEVDKYVEHVSERYNSVCKENAELKRRLLAEGVRMREAEEKIAELESTAVQGVALDKSELVKIFDALNAEKERFAYFVESLKESLNDICAESEEALTADDSWEEVLDGYVEEVHNEDDTSSAVSDGNEGFYEICDDDADSVGEITPACEEVCETVAEDDAYGAETDDVLSIFNTATAEDKADISFVVPDLDGDVFADGDPAEDDTPSDEDVITEEDADMDADEETAGDENEHDERTPAQIAADLDFYTDGDHADGESFDPMTLAAQITSRNSRPKISDFMKTVPSDEN
ncbi:MAG: DivIVA domain-containing protein [Clostridia bacterium]|nr:DivIVA domain-containing protein [Clostridia bacterium]